MNNELLRVGGWGDLYYALLEFDLTGLPSNPSSAVLYLYCGSQSGGGTPMYLDRVTQAWDWRTSGTGRDRLRLWWADRPQTVQWLAPPRESRRSTFFKRISVCYTSHRVCRPIHSESHTRKRKNGPSRKHEKTDPPPAASPGTPRRPRSLRRACAETR